MALATTLKFTKEKLLPDGLERLKVLINSSTPIVVMETSEEVRAVNLVRTACSELNMATFEWTIADGLVRSSSTAAPSSPLQGASLGIQARIDQSTGWTAAARQARSVLSPGGGEADRLTRSLTTSMVVDSGAAAGASMYNSRDPVQALANMQLTDGGTNQTDSVFTLNRVSVARFTTQFTLPGVESGRAFELLKSRFPARSPKYPAPQINRALTVRCFGRAAES